MILCLSIFYFLLTIFIKLYVKDANDALVGVIFREITFSCLFYQIFFNCSLLVNKMSYENPSTTLFFLNLSASRESLHPVMFVILVRINVDLQNSINRTGQ